jgi:hypothetical protein
MLHAALLYEYTFFKTKHNYLTFHWPWEGQSRSVPTEGYCWVQSTCLYMGHRGWPEEGHQPDGQTCTATPTTDNVVQSARLYTGIRGWPKVGHRPDRQTCTATPVNRQSYTLMTNFPLYNRPANSSLQIFTFTESFLLYFFWNWHCFHLKL